MRSAAAVAANAAGVYPFFSVTKQLFKLYFVYVIAAFLLFYSFQQTSLQSGNKEAALNVIIQPQFRNRLPHFSLCMLVLKEFPFSYFNFLPRNA